MKLLTEYLSAKVKPSIIKADDKTLRNIVVSELERVGLNADLNHIDTSKVTKMDCLFATNRIYNKTTLPHEWNTLNVDVSKWNVENVINTNFMFDGDIEFNCDLSNWNLKSIVEMNAMFAECEKFDCDLSNWQTDNLQYAQGTFKYCKSFKGNGIEKWNVGKLISSWSMFLQCENFEGDVSSWRPYNLESCAEMFKCCPKFNSDVSEWRIPKVTTVFDMFYKCINFKQDLSHWELPNVKTRGHTFFKCPMPKEYLPKFGK